MKYVFVNRIQKYFLRSLIYKKYLFMSMKYRALKVFFSLFRCRLQPLMHGKIKKILIKS